MTYQLRNEVNNAKIGAPVFYNWDRGLDETTLNYDYVIGTHEGDQVTLPIGKISADKAFNILATKSENRKQHSTRYQNFNHGEITRMASHTHIIGKQLIEIKIRDRKLAEAAQKEISRIYNSKIVPMIDEVCTRYTDPNIRYRIEKLEFDLGILSSHNLEEEIVSRVQRQLVNALTDVLEEQEEAWAEKHSLGATKAGSQLELLRFFLETGALPWWVETPNANTVISAFTHSLETSPLDLTPILRTSFNSTHQFKRLLNTFTDEQLMQWVHLAFPQLRLELDKVFAVLKIARVGIAKDLEVNDQINKQTFRKSIWRSVFFLLLANQHGISSTAEFYRALLTQVSGVYPISFEKFLQQIIASLKSLKDSKFNFEGTFEKVVEKLFNSHQQMKTKQHSPASNTPTTESSADISPTTEKALNQDDPTPTAPSTPAVLISQLSLIALRGAVKIKELPLLQRLLLSAVKTPGIHLNTQAIQQLLKRINKHLIEHGLSSQDPDSRPSSPKSHPHDRLNMDEETALLNALKALLDEDAAKETPASTEQDSFSDSDRITVYNGGLVLLWPYLRQFFSALGLISKEKFTDITSQEKAAMILQFLVNGEMAQAEFMLPLNKILCGLPILHPIPTEIELTPHEVGECEHLLTTVLSHWKGVGQLSLDGFRTSWLQREAILSIKDGRWLVQIDPAPYDILLQGIPWSISAFKLPWMEMMVEVEI